MVPEDLEGSDLVDLAALVWAEPPWAVGAYLDPGFVSCLFSVGE